MTCIRRISVRKSFRNIPPLEIDLAPDDQHAFRHLILTGPNGSGKSSLLDMIQARLPLKRRSRDLPAEVFAVDLQLGPDELKAIAKMHFGHSLGAYMPARRSLHPHAVDGPRKLELDKANGTSSDNFLQFLVNMHTERAYAQVDGAEDEARRIDAWFEALTGHLRWLVDDPGLELRFDRTNFNFVIHRSDGFEFDLRTLADGHASVISILAELFLRIEACQRAVGDRSYQPDGIVIIDEIETHLHLRLQEQILPFLTELMPRLQFIVATHSPAVISSIPNAVVYDLGTREQVLSDELRGIRYGTLMTEHFGIESDMDVESTKKLERAQELMRMQTRTEAEEQELSEIAGELSGRSSTLALELWEAKEQLEGVVIDVERSQPAPASLAQKKDWRGQDVLERLFEDFLGKCYLCEAPFFGLGSFEVDHRWPKRDGGMPFDWGNLFPICKNCNGRRAKGWPDGGLLDPAGGHGVERRVVQVLEPDEDGDLIPAFRAAAVEDRLAINTVAELDHIHNQRRGVGCLKAGDLRDAIRARLVKVQTVVLEYLHAKQQTPEAAEQLREYEQRIRRLVGRDKPFTMLVRSAIRDYVPAELLD